MRRLLLAVCAAQLVGCAAPMAAPQSESPSAPLAGTRWMGVVDASLERNAVPWVEFVREGRLTGYTGCNMLSGTWSEQGGVARIGGVVTTKRMCLGPGDAIEKRVLAALSAESRVSRQGDRLVFVAPGGARFEFAAAR